MQRDRAGARWRHLSSLFVGSVVAALVAGVGTMGAAGAVSPPALSITPGPYHNGQYIDVSVGPNRFFKPYARVNIIECADPGGKKSNLPVNADTCDGNTIQGDTILVHPNGSFSVHRYQVFALPNTSALGEQPDGQPVCNQKKMCVFYIGQNQEKFTAPKVFSAPFTVSKSSKNS